jgi:hypothetical protein
MTIPNSLILGLVAYSWSDGTPDTTAAGTTTGVDFNDFDDGYQITVPADQTKRSHAHGWVVMLAMAGIVGSHAYSQGAVVWVCINEVLPNAIRASGSAAACCLLWVLDVAVSWSFPVVAGQAGAYAFGFFAVMMVAQFFFVLKFFPETKGVSLEELQRRLGVEA